MTAPVHSSIDTGVARLLALLALAACNGDDGGGPQAGAGGGAQCLPELSLDCAPSFQPTYEAFYENHLRGTCSTGGGNCHGESGAQGGLVLSDRDRAYDYLIGEVDGRPRVLAGDPECSTLILRLESDDPDFVMPQGNQLLEGERCAVRQWIANGAER